MERVGVLLTRTCTTGMMDWTHGELWLCPDGLLRSSVGLVETVRLGVDLRMGRRVGPTVDPTNRPRQQISDDDITRVTGLDKRNRWIRRADITEARVSGTLQRTLALKLRDGTTPKFLWAPVDKFDDLLDPWLGGLRR